MIREDKSSNSTTESGEDNNTFEVQAILTHRGEYGEYEYLVHWKGYDDPKENTWEKETQFDSKYHIKLYWKRRDAANKANKFAPSINNANRKRANRNKHSNKNAKVIASCSAPRSRKTRSTSSKKKNNSK